MNIADELRKLQELHQSGALTDAEFAAAKRAVLSRAGADEGTPPSEDITSHWNPNPQPRYDPRRDEPRREDPEISRELAHLRRETELMRLDQEWASERESYYMSGRYGSRYKPSYATGAFTITAALVFGGIWTVFAGGLAWNGSFGVFPVFGLFFILFGIGVGGYQIYRASQYQQAEESYRRRRQWILTGRAEPQHRPEDD